MNPFLDTGFADAAHRGRSQTSLVPPTSTHSAPSRSSLLPSVKIPYLRRLDIRDAPPPVNKSPILTLKLTSPSFLDSYVKDDLSKHPLYAIKTVGTSTTITRSDHMGESQTAEIKWPKILPVKGKGKDVTDGVQIQMRGARWKGGETLLRPGTTLSSHRKFNIPNYSQHMKWKRVGSSYWCTTPSVKGPVAVLEVASGPVPPKLVVYETLHDKYDARLLLVHQGVALVLLDYLLVTALLLVTDVQEWMVVRKFEGKSILIPNLNDTDNGPRSAFDVSSTSASQWRKIMFGEPIYPKLSSGEPPGSPKLSPTSLSPTASDPLPSTPTSATSDTMPQFVYRHSVDSGYSHLPESTLDLSTSSESEDEEDGLISRSQTRPPSPSAESIFYPLTNASAPSHTYLDPSFYNPNNVPPVPALPEQYRRASGSGSHHSHGDPQTNRSRPSSPASTTSPSSRRIRGLPVPPTPPQSQEQPQSYAQSCPRPRSTPPQTTPAHGTNQRPLPASSASIISPARRPSDPGAGRSRVSMSTRPLPLPPPLSASQQQQRSSTAAPRLRPAQSSSSLTQEMFLAHSHSTSKHRSPRSQRSLPPTPLAMAHTIDHSAGTGSSHPAQPGPRARHKTSEEDLARWMHVLTSPGRQAGGAVEDDARTSVYEPPPAYNTLFHGEVPQLDPARAAAPEEP